MTELNTTKPIISQIEEWVDGVPGWTPIDQLYSLYMLAVTTEHLGGDILELGSWCGRSAAVLGKAAQKNPATRVHCIDLFPEKDDWFENADGSYSFAVTLNGRRFNAYHDQTVWAEPFLGQIAPVYAQDPSLQNFFQATIRNRQLDRTVLTHRGNLETFFADQTNASMRVRLAFVDGDHSFDAVCRDIEMIEEHLLSGGWICFDDAFSSYDGVNRAIERKILDSGNYELCQQLTRKFFVARKK